MSRVLAYTSPARGHLYPIVPILRELRDRGHEVVLRTLSSELGAMRALGFRAGPICERIEAIELDDYRLRGQPAKGWRALRVFAARAEHEAADLRGAIEEHRPDVALIDFNCWGAATAAEACGRPWATYCPYLLPQPSRDVPPYGLGLAPMRGPLGALRDAIGSRVLGAVSDRGAMPAINALRVRHGLGTLDRFVDFLARPPVLLALTAEGFEYPRSEWPANVRLVGAIDWSPWQDAPGWLSELRDPLVLVTCSTERQDDERLVDVALSALPRAGMSAIVTSAAHDPAGFRAPPQSRVVRFLSHEAVLPRAACVVCHGGMGITQKALASGVPVVVVPFGRDQFETARRVEVARAGVRLPSRRLTSARLLAAVRDAMQCKPGAERVSRAYAAAGGRLAAADAIEKLHASAPGRVPWGA